MAATESGEVHVLGVRHHGPGSARSVLAALQELTPDVVIIEGPPELDAVASLAAVAGMQPPVAALVYDQGAPRNFSFYPLAAFSPEWVALQWALGHGIPVRFADLPAANFLAARDAEDDVAPDGSGEPEGEDDAEPADLDEQVEGDAELERADPISMLAQVAGYSDPERWWEDAIEHRADTVVTRFGHVTDAMTQVRSARPDLDDAENQRREAAMRKVIRTAMAEHDVVAVVCGAFHAPALQPATFPSRAADNRLLSGLAKTKVGATWVPWTNDRLARASGYGAGITAPGWYHHLFEAHEAGDPEVVSGWLVKTARALREQQFEAAPAGVVEAVRLAQTLASVRGRPGPGLPELDDAALAVLCNGSQERLELVRRELFVGDVVGAVPPETPMVPLAADLQRTQKSLRLKPSPTESVVQLDLRRPAQLDRSILFHRLNLLEVPWATAVDAGRTGGTFKEVWTLEWRPELTVALIEASRYGTTLDSACATKVSEQAAQADLPTLSGLVEFCLMADLPDGLRSVVDRLGRQTARSHDIVELLGTIAPMARTARYGDVRGLDTQALQQLSRVVVRRVCVGLRAGCQSLDDDAAQAMRKAVESAHAGITLLASPDLTRPWLDALSGLEETVHGGVSGRADRILLDAGRIDASHAAARMSRRLSVAEPALRAAAWLDAFLGEDPVLLLHDPALLGIIDDWVSEIREETFEDLLPLLRRTFSAFETASRRQLAARLESGPSTVDASTTPADPEQAHAVVVATARLIGLETTP